MTQNPEPTPPTAYAPAWDAQLAGGPVTYHGAPAGPVGKIRSTGVCILLSVVTIGFYTLYWYYKTHEEMRRHSGQGLGGLIALVLAFVIGVVMPFFTSNEVGNLYERKGQRAPVTAVTGLWFLLLGWFFFVGAIIWFVRTNAALNAYWRSQGATG